MFGKSRRFRADEGNTTDAPGKTSPGLVRESPVTAVCEDKASALQGAVSEKNTFMGDSETSAITKRSNSTDRKVGVTDKKKSVQKELKRTISYIPRVAHQRAKTPISADAKKSGRKSETSLKNKEVAEAEASKEKKTEAPKAVAVKQGAMRKRSESSQVADRSRRNLDVPPGHVRDQSVSRPKALSTRSGADSLGRSEKYHRVTASSTVENIHPGGGKSVEAQYHAKRTVYGLMVKEFEEKQKAIRDQYRILQELRKRAEATTGRDMPPEEMIKIGEVGPPFIIRPEVVRKYCNTLNKREIVTFESKILKDLKMDFSEFESSFLIGMNKYQDIWTNIVPSIINQMNETLHQLTSEISPEKKEEVEKLGKNLEHSVENAKYLSAMKSNEILSEIKRLYTNRENIKEELKFVLDSEKFSNFTVKEYREVVARLREVEEELAKEKVRSEDLMEKRDMLQVTKMVESEKIESLEQTIASQQNQIAELENQCKVLKQKELMANRGMAGIKPKDLKDLKAKSELLKALEIHITELTNDYNDQKKEFQTRIADLELSLKETEEALKLETQAKESLEASLAEAEETIRCVREKKKAFSDMVDKTKQIIQSTNAAPSKREEQLWAELEATKIVVKGYQDQLNKLTEEKNKILLKFQTISEDKSNQNAERLAADLVRKEEIIKTLKDQVTQLQTACEEHSVKYNKLLAQVKEVHERMDGKSNVATLSKQLSDVKSQKKELQEVVKELVSHNKELETALIQRSLELDQRDRLVKQQCNLLKMRDELTELVRSKEDILGQGAKKTTEPGSQWEKRAEKIYKDLEKKANESDDIYKVLVEKQKQVEKLTKLVKIMEDQQDRAQEQRVRFESKIAELQRQLVEEVPKPSPPLLFGN